ncbi:MULTISPECIES: hypothetical protein [Phenylobacterium]|uniref:Transcription elongation factor n=1 Tax=Phenylobacterium koreense TaxID=266125 RepID=A0ABV2EEZ3_9CAUL
MDKSRIRDRLLSLEAHELHDTAEAYSEYVAGAHIDAGAPIDDQEQSQAVQSRNLAEAFECPLHDHLEKIDLLKRIDFGTKTRVEAGAIVKFDDRYYVIGVATGRFAYAGHAFMGISTQAPIFEELEGRRAGERFKFKGHEHLIQEVT